MLQDPTPTYRGNPIACALDEFVSPGRVIRTSRRTDPSKASESLRQLLVLEDVCTVPFSFADGITFCSHGQGPCNLLTAPLGIVISNPRGNTGSPAHCAAILLRLQILPGIESVLCLDADCLMRDREHMFVQFLQDNPEIQLLYNNSDFAPYIKPLVPAEKLLFRKGSDKADYYGTTPRKVAELKEWKDEEERRARWRQELHEIVAPLILVPEKDKWKTNSYILPPVGNKVEDSLPALMFDADLKLPSRMPVRLHNQAAKWLVGHVEFHGEVEEGYEHLFDNEPGYPDIQRVRGVCRIWQEILSREVVKLNCNECQGVEMMSKIAAIGKSLGVDAAIEAYLAGAPLDHILAR